MKGKLACVFGKPLNKKISDRGYGIEILFIAAGARLVIHFYKR